MRVLCGSVPWVEGLSSTGGRPMDRNVDTIITPATTAAARERYGTTLLLRHCLSLGTAEHRIPARARLERAIGPELARRLVTSLLAHSRR